MLFCKEEKIKIASLDDAPAITNLLNSAYRGESSRKGWTTEANIIAGDQRTTVEEIRGLINPPSSVFLIYSEKITEGCVNLQQRDNKLYLGLFSVNPERQGKGIGKKLLHASEKYAVSLGCDMIFMTVIDIREELINWYKKHGYVDTGARKRFEEDGVSGKHLQKLQFMVLEKNLH